MVETHTITGEAKMLKHEVVPPFDSEVRVRSLGA